MEKQNIFFTSMLHSFLCNYSDFLEYIVKKKLFKTGFLNLICLLIDRFFVRTKLHESKNKMEECGE